MKTVQNLIFFMLVAVVGMNSTALAGSPDRTESRNVKSFNGIKVSTGIDLYLSMGNSEEVKIVAEDDIIDDIVTEVKNGVLHIYMEKNNWFNWGRINETRKAYVTVKQLELIDASSGSDVRSENTLKGNVLDIEASSGSDVYLEIVYKNVSVKTSSGSDARLKGKAKYFAASASSGSDIVARDLETEKCNVKASSGSDATVNVSEELVAKASSGADIRYYGNPKIKDINESSGGDIAGR